MTRTAFGLAALALSIALAGGAFAADGQAQTGDGSVRPQSTNQNMTSGEQSQTTALLLPAVQKVREAAAR